MRITLSLIVALALAFTAAAQNAKPKSYKPSTETPASVHAKLDVDYATYGDRAMQLDLFTPKAKSKKPRPAIVVVHGGGWKSGDRAKFRAIGQQLAARGYVTAAISYRLAGDTKFPAAIYDCKAAVRYLRANAKRLNLDPNRIGAIGGSAGGHLVGLMATSSAISEYEGAGGNAKFSSNLNAAVVLGGGMDLVTKELQNPNPDNEISPNALLFFGARYREIPDVYVKASPITHISASTPPMLFMDGEFDQPQKRYIDFWKKMDDYRIPHSFIQMDGGKHGCWNQEPWFTPMIKDIDQFFKKAM